MVQLEDVRRILVGNVENLRSVIPDLDPGDSGALAWRVELGRSTRHGKFHRNSLGVDYPDTVAARQALVALYTRLDKPLQAAQYE